jgi:hypothetical protein
MFEKLLLKIIGTQPSPAALLSFAAEPIEVIDDPVKLAIETTDAEERRQEKERLRAIINSSEAQGRSRLALYLATETELSPEASKAILAAADREVTDAPTAPGKLTPKEVNAAQCANFFEQHRAENPELWNPQPPLSVAETISRMTHNYAAVTGMEVTPK